MPGRGRVFGRRHGATCPPMDDSICSRLIGNGASAIRKIPGAARGKVTAVLMCSSSNCTERRESVPLAGSQSASWLPEAVSLAKHVVVNWRAIQAAISAENAPVYDIRALRLRRVYFQTRRTRKPQTGPGSCLLLALT